MIAVMIIPTGIGCEIGGHSGDATPAAKLLASVCDKLIIHPNVVNASDINEMSANMLYVEGSMLDRFLQGKIQLKEVESNKILLVCNKPVPVEIINSASAARATIGADVTVLELKTELRMISRFDSDGVAIGDVFGYEELVQQVSKYKFDALAISSRVEVTSEVQNNYWKEGGVNPWGGVEAKASKLISGLIGKPVAHAPWETLSYDQMKKTNLLVDPRMSAEMVSMSFIHCVLKGLHKAPRIATSQDRFCGKGVIKPCSVDCLISPIGCWGLSHKACAEQHIPIIMVKENSTCLNEDMGNVIVVENYLEAVGYLKCMQIGISSFSVRRPLTNTVVLGSNCKCSPK